MKKIFLTCASALIAGSLSYSAQDNTQSRDGYSVDGRAVEQGAADLRSAASSTTHAKQNKEKYALNLEEVDAQLVQKDRRSEGKKSVDRMLGAEVMDSQGESLGSIKDLVLEDDSVEVVHISVGGVLGIGGDTIAVPFDELSELSRENDDTLRYQLNVRSQALHDEIDRVTAQIENQRDAREQELAARGDTRERGLDSAVASVEREINQALADHRERNGGDRPEVDVQKEGNAIVLSGKVSSEDLRNQLADVARDATEDDVTIRNEIQLSADVAQAAN